MAEIQYEPVPRLRKERGWPALFWEAFKRSRNGMVLLDERRVQLEVNGAYLELLGYRRGEVRGRPVWEIVADGPLLSTREWRHVLGGDEFTGVAELVCRDGSRVKVEFAGHPEVVTGRRLILVVAVRTARGTRRLPPPSSERSPETPLSQRELEVAELIALGLSGPEIAEEIRLTHNTVRTHTRNAMIKVGARSRAHLVAKLLADGSYLAVR